MQLKSLQKKISHLKTMPTNEVLQESKVVGLQQRLEELRAIQPLSEESSHAEESFMGEESLMQNDSQSDEEGEESVEDLYEECEVPEASIEGTLSDEGLRLAEDRACRVLSMWRNGAPPAKRSKWTTYQDTSGTEQAEGRFVHAGKRAFRSESPRSRGGSYSSGATIPGSDSPTPRRDSRKRSFSESEAHTYIEY